MKKKTQKYVIKIIVALISAIALVLAAIIAIIPSLWEPSVPTTAEDENPGGVTIESIGDGNSIEIYNEVQGDIYRTEETINNINTYITNEDSELINPLVQAAIHCRNGEYDQARAIYEQEEYSDNKEALINLGYIYGEGISYLGKNLEKLKHIIYQQIV